MEHHDLLVGLVRLHVLHHAAEHEIYGQWMLNELANHGYRLSPGTLYPMLHGMERKGYLVSHEERNGSRRRKLYRATDLGQEGLAVAKRQLRELTGEAMNNETCTSKGGKEFEQ
ncbi:MAG: PadR family transcriptional regulator [Pseudomonadota bacterium]|uniref:PadR family transcriptional regulator n=1 Tax=Salinicola salarius TaxID=430457 RepID=UPI000B3FA22B|nr:PadR family transcriptional regulator [Salinicola salarius]MEA3252356.1 PadR family transcriptional regulator [Pseudomonadota bacterium]MEC8916070.1 PadR family transcriptional regulator [Pseudomonadota bacterium]